MSEETQAPGPPSIPAPKKRFYARPEISGTQVHLRANRQKASSAYRIAREQEHIYITKRQAGFGKQEAVKGKEHLQVAQKSLCAGVTCIWHAAANLPAILKEKRVNQKQHRIMKRMEREEEAKKNLEKIAAPNISMEEAPAAAE